MTAKTGVMVVVDIHVDTDVPVPAEQFHANARALMDELMELDGCNPDIADPTVSSDAAEAVLRAEILVFTDDALEATQKAMTVLQTALHAVGASTVNWPRIERLENHTEVAGDLNAV